MVPPPVHPDGYVNVSAIEPHPWPQAQNKQHTSRRSPKRVALNGTSYLNVPKKFFGVCYHSNWCLEAGQSLSAHSTSAIATFGAASAPSDALFKTELSSEFLLYTAKLDRACCAICAVPQWRAFVAGDRCGHRPCAVAVLPKPSATLRPSQFLALCRGDLGRSQ